MRAPINTAVWSQGHKLIQGEDCCVIMIDDDKKGKWFVPLNSQWESCSRVKTPQSGEDVMKCEDSAAQQLERITL